MPAIITISSHVAHGAVGNRIIVPALEALGISVTALSTVVLPWHPGMNIIFGKAAPVVPDDEDFASIVDSLCAAPWLSNIDAIITGYLGSARQAEIISSLVIALKRANPSAHYLCDPVIGDHGALYVPEATAVAIRNHLWPLADSVTPNTFEFGWMTGLTTTNHADIIEAATGLHKRHVIVTSFEAGANKIGNLLVSNAAPILVSHQTLSHTPNGTGDLLTALFAGFLAKGDNASDALSKAAATVAAAIKYANQTTSSSLAPEHLQTLLNAAIRPINSQSIV